MYGSKAMALVLIAGSLAGCSVGMALSGDPAPDLSVVKIGAPRDDVELQLGQPHKSVQQANGTEVATYKYEVGNDPNAVRAIGHAALDVASVGLWEVVGTPIEAATGDEFELEITYDELGRVMELKQGS